MRAKSNRWGHAGRLQKCVSAVAIAGLAAAVLLSCDDALAQGMTNFGQRAVQEIQTIKQQGQQVASEGGSTIKLWAIIISGLGLVALAVGAAFKMFNKGWALQVAGSLVGFACIGGLIYGFTGVNVGF